MSAHLQLTGRNRHTDNINILTHTPVRHTSTSIHVAGARHTQALWGAGYLSACGEGLDHTAQQVLQTNASLTAIFRGSGHCLCKLHTHTHTYNTTQTNIRDIHTLIKTYAHIRHSFLPFIFTCHVRVQVCRLTCSAKFSNSRSKISVFFLTADFLVSVLGGLVFLS